VEAETPNRVYSHVVENRPLRTALGWRLPNWLLTVAPVAFIVLEGGLAIGFHGELAPGRVVVLSLALTAIAVALLLRHRAPLIVLGVVLAGTLALNYGPIVLLPVLLAMFTVAEYADRATLVGAAAVAGTVVVLTPLAHGFTEAPTQFLSRLVAIGLAVAVGLWLRARSDYVAGLHERAERLERERELLAQQAVADERVRIARELHDVVAHNVSLMVVQAQALAATGGGSEDQQAALSRVANLGREALSEMHRMLGVLRIHNGASPELEPQPGVRDLEKLIAHTREAGVTANLIIEGEPRDLPAGVDLSAYRIVQEALTNVVKHAGADHAVVTLSFAPRALEVTIADDGNGPPDLGAQANGQGHGLVGMRERVALFGGQLQAAPGADGHGYRVHAVLPIS